MTTDSELICESLHERFHADAWSKMETSSSNPIKISGKGIDGSGCPICPDPLGRCYAEGLLPSEGRRKPVDGVFRSGGHRIRRCVGTRS